MRVVTFFLTKTGLVLPVGEEAPQHAPWSGAEVRFRRIQGDHALGVVRPRDEVRAQTDAEGKGQVGLEPGVYEITLPAGDTYVRAIEDGTEPLDLSVVLAAGVPPTEPHYETLIEWITTNPNLKGPKGDTGEQGPPGPEGPQGPAGEGLDPSQSYTFTAQQVFEDGVKVSREGQALVVNADTVPAEIELQFAGARVGAVSADSGAVRVAADSGAADLELEGTAIQSGAPGGTDAPWVHRGTLDVSGDVVAGGRVDASADVTAVNNVSAGIDVTAGQDVLAIRDIIADRDVTAGRNVVVDEELIAFGAVRGPIIDTGGAVANVRAFGAVGDGIADDSAALTAASALGTTVVLPAGTYRIASTMSIYFPIRLEKGAVLKPDAGVTVTIVGGLQAGLYQIFDGPGTVRVRRVPAIYPQWWGAVGNDTGDDGAALQAAFNCAGRVVLVPGIYPTSQELTVPSNTTILGAGNSWGYALNRNDTVIKYIGSANNTIAVLRLSTAAVGVEPTTALSNVHVSKITIDANNLAGNGLWAAFLSNDSTLEDITAIKATRQGIRIEKWWYGRATGLIARNCQGCGITIGRLGWGGVNGIHFRNLRAAFCGLDKTFDQDTNYEWGYGIGLYLGSGSLVTNVVSERNDGPGLLYNMGPGVANSVRGIYLEANCLDAKSEGRAARNYGLIVKGGAFARAHTLESIYLNGETGQANAQAVLLTGDAPTPLGAITFRDMAFGEGFDAEWDRYKFEGYISPGLTGTENNQKPRTGLRKVFEQHGVNLRFTSTINECRGYVDNDFHDTTIYFIPHQDVNLSTAPRVRFRDFITKTTHYDWTLPTSMTAGTVYKTSFRTGNLGANKLGEIVGVDTADIDCFGTIGLAIQEQSGADYEL